ncbi:NAD(P)/FAD-dependent oxidoreductase, partial [Hyella patelloides]
QNKQISSCLVIGGGISGLIIASILQRNGIKVTVLDKGRGIGGRLATKRIQEGVFDYGAQYFSVKNPQFQKWVDEWLQAGIVTEWCQQFTPEDKSKPRYRGLTSSRSIAKYLAKDLDVHTSTKVTKLNYQDSQWLIETEKGNQFPAEMLIMTPPVPQTLALLDNSNITIPANIKNSLEQIKYYQCIAVLALLEKPSNIPSPGGILLDKEPLVWLADNYQKGISPNYAVTLHATPKFSETHYSSDNETIAKLLFDAASDWLNDSVIEYQVHRWRYSLPRTFYHQQYCALSEFPLVMAGDAFVAPKIEGALLSGIAAANYVLNSQS